MTEEQYRENLHQGAKGKLFANAIALRQRQTSPEKILWPYLRNRRLSGWKFRRQHPIDCYILDFYCHECRLAVELDGGIHHNKMNKQYDEARTQRLQELGIKVIRFPNEDVEKRIEWVLGEILKCLV